MFFCRKIWKLLIIYYIRRNIKRRHLLRIFKYPSTSIPRLFWSRKLRRKKFEEFYSHNGRCLKPIDLIENKIPVSYYAETLTYGQQKKKKKALKKKAKVNTAKKTTAKKTTAKKTTAKKTTAKKTTAKKTTAKKKK